MIARTAKADAIGDAVLRALSRGRCVELVELFSIVDQVLGDDIQNDCPVLDRAMLRTWLCDHPELVDLTPRGWVLRAGVRQDLEPRPPTRASRCSRIRRGGVLIALRELGHSTVAELAVNLGISRQSVYLQLSVHRKHVASYLATDHPPRRVFHLVDTSAQG